MAPILVAINGCLGRVGRRLCVLACADTQIKLVGAVTHPDDKNAGLKLCDVEKSISCEADTQGDIQTLVIHKSLSDLKVKPQVVIDFSSPNGVSDCLKYVKDQAAEGVHVNLVIGTTGLTPSSNEAVTHASKEVAILHAMNFSLGVNLMRKIVKDTAKALPKDYNIEIVEAHHNKKIDAPSGTAWALVDSICEDTDYTRENVVHGRDGIVGKRPQKEIGLHAVRTGSVIGEHTVIYGNEFERIEIKHKAETRDTFAYGALKAAIWLAEKRPGMYNMEDVLFE